jgi:hypothetical protein
LKPDADPVLTKTVAVAPVTDPVLAAQFPAPEFVTGRVSNSMLTQLVGEVRGSPPIPPPDADDGDGV